MASSLDRLRDAGDGLGAYLGDGITRTHPIRSRILAQCLQELLEKRQISVDN